jgi:hypothetical protein
MRGLCHSTQIDADVPSATGQVISIFVAVDHPLLKLKRALAWEKLRQVMVEHWRQAGKNVAGGPGACPGRFPCMYPCWF